MNKSIKIVLALLCVSIVVSCKKAESNEEISAESVSDSVSVSSSQEKIISSSAAVEPKNRNKKFVRTADIKFKVKNVAKSTTIIEDATTKFGGFVTYTNLESQISEEDKTKISPDSSLVTTKFTVENNITIRVPNTKLDTVIKSIATQIKFLNYRVIKADDVTLQMVANQMSQERSATSENRIANDIDNKGKKLNQIIDAEETLNNKKEANDTSKLENLSLQDKVSFSTLTLQIYQDEIVKQEMIGNQKSTNAYRPNIGLQILDSIKTGWFMLEEILSFIVVLWPFFGIGLLSYLGYKKYSKKQI